MYRGRTSGVWPDFRDLMSRTARENALQEPVVRGTGRMSGGLDVRGYGPDVRAPNPRMNSRNSILGAEIDDFGGKIAEISWMESGEIGGKLDPQVTKQIHRSNSTKHHHTNKSQKKLGLFLVGIFEFRTKSTKLG